MTIQNTVPSLYELQLPASFLALLAPALEANGLYTENAAVRGSNKLKPYTYTQLLGDKGPFCCLLHIDDQFLKDVHYFDDLAIMLQAFTPDQELIIFLDAACFPPVQLRRLVECERNGRVRYITLADLEDLSSKHVSFSADALGLREMVVTQAHGEPYILEGNRLTISLLHLMRSPEGWGHARGASVADVIQSYIEASPAQIVRFSLQGVKRMDVTCASELVRLVKHERMKRGFCLVDGSDPDLLMNWDAAALCHNQPLFVWNVQMTCDQLGPKPGIGLRQMLQHVLSVAQTSTSEAASALSLKTQNASNKLKQLWQEGFILRQERSAASGGVEYDYLRIA